MSATSHSSETITITTNSNTIVNVNMSNVTKLTSSNFLMWSRQIHALLDGYDLSGHIDGSIAIPSSTITTDAGVSTNPAYNLWKRQDRLIYSALLGAITTTLQPILSSTNTAAEIWRTLSDTYAKPSRGHYKQPLGYIHISVYRNCGTYRVTMYYIYAVFFCQIFEYHINMKLFCKLYKI